MIYEIKKKVKINEKQFTILDWKLTIDWLIVITTKNLGLELNLLWFFNPLIIKMIKTKKKKMFKIQKSNKLFLN